MSIVLVTIDERAFLRAVFRGGRERIAFTARAASHFAAATGHSARVAEAIAGVADPLDQVARLVLLAHAIQRSWFDALLELRPDVASIDFAQVRDDPLAALGTALAALGLASLPDRLSAAVENRAAVDAKQPDRRFSRTAQAEDDDSVERHHGDRFDRALGWASAKKF